MRAKLLLLVLMACQLALILSEVQPVSWWDGP